MSPIQYSSSHWCQFKNYIFLFLSPFFCTLLYFCSLRREPIFLLTVEINQHWLIFLIPSPTCLPHFPQFSAQQLGKWMETQPLLCTTAIYTNSCWQAVDKSTLVITESNFKAPSWNSSPGISLNQSCLGEGMGMVEGKGWGEQICKGLQGDKFSTRLGIHYFCNVFLWKKTKRFNREFKQATRSESVEINRLLIWEGSFSSKMSTHTECQHDWQWVLNQVYLEIR